jgi:hypothetical protein
MTRITAASLTGEATTSSALVEMLPRVPWDPRNREQAPRTIDSYAESVRRLYEYLAEGSLDSPSVRGGAAPAR